MVKNNNKIMKHIKKFKINEEGGGVAGSGDASGGGVAGSTLGNTYGMGPIVAPQPSSVPGDTQGSSIGSGDKVATGFPAAIKQQFPKKKRKKKKKNENLILNFSEFKNNE